jgi:hypothetical protein
LEEILAELKKASLSPLNVAVLDKTLQVLSNIEEQRKIENLQFVADVFLEVLSAVQGKYHTS